MRAGLSREGALAALTDGPARIYGLEGRIGRIAPGADADLAVWSGDPFTLAAAVEIVLVDGRIAWRKK
jgi:imidazolonepropionase-like amidohydrolase